MFHTINRALVPQIVITLCFSFLIVISIFPEVVTKTAISTVHSSSIKVTVLDDKNKDSLGREAFIWGSGAGSVEYGVYEGFLKTVENKGFKFIPKDPWVKNFIHTGVAGDYVVLNLKEMPNAWVGVLQRPDASKILVEYDGISKVFDLYNKEHLSAEFRIYPFEFNNSIALGWIIRLLIFYCLYFVIIFITICLLYKFFRTIQMSYLSLPNRFLPNFMIFFVLQLVFYIIWQHFNSEYLKVGDASWYWEIAKIVGVVEGDFSLKSYALNEPFVVRSYLLPLIILFIRAITGYNELFSKILYLVFSSGVASFFICFTMPKLYELLTGKKAYNVQVYVFGLIFLYFWWGLVFNPLVDMYASVFYFSAVVFLLMGQRVLQNGVSITLGGGGIFLLAGVFLAATVLMRSNYVLPVNLCLIFLFLACIINVFAGKIGAFKGIREKNLFFKNFNFLHMGLILAGMFIICLPELIINYYRGVFSFFQYDRVGVYTSPLQSLSTQLIAESFRVSAGWPNALKNFSGVELMSQVYPYADINRLSILDCFSMYMSYPLKTIAIFGMKLFQLIDIKTNIIYPTLPGYLHIDLLANKILSFINYIIYGIVILCLIIKRNRIYLFNRFTLIFMTITFVMLGLPQLLFHVEWRFFLSIDIFVYYIFAYLFVGSFIDAKSPLLIKGRLFSLIMKLFCLVVFMYSISIMINTASKW